MLKKFPFRVIYCSGWDDEYSAKDLEVHSPFIKGWRSPRFCPYPQEIVIQIDPPGRIRKIQLLSHQHLIATTIAIYVGRFTSDTHTSMDHAKFSRLGYVSLSSNEASNFRTMELKSVNVDCCGQLIKLVLRQNHVNRLNIFNQVGLVAVNIIGEPLTSGGRVANPTEIPSRLIGIAQQTPQLGLASLVHTSLPGIKHTEVDPMLKSEINKATNISPLDDLSFAVSQDPETADLIRELERRKLSAIQEENYMEAKKLKTVIDELSKAGTVLCRYAVEKKEAIAREDYDTAKSKKEKLDEARKQIYEDLGLHVVVGGRHPTSTTTSTTASSITTATTATRSKQSPHLQSIPRVNWRGGPFTTSQTNESGAVKTSTDEMGKHSSVLPPISVSNKSPSHPSSFEPVSPTTASTKADERPLPTLARRSGGQENFSEQDSPDKWEGEGMPTGPGKGAMETGEEEDIMKVAHLSEKQCAQVSHAVEVFGMEVLEQLYAKQYSIRERSLSNILEQLMSKEEGLARKEVVNTVKATCEVLVKGLKDTVFSTFTSSQDVLRYLVGPFAECQRLSNQDMTLIMEKIAKVLLLRTGDLSPRIYEASMDLLTELMRHDRIQGLTFFGPMLVEPYGTKGPPSWRLIRGRIVLLERLMEKPGMASSGLNIRKIMKFLMHYLDHNMSEVRDAAIRVTMLLYRINGTEVRSLMPVPDDTASRKKTLWRMIYEGFDKIDGIPTRAEREAVTKAAQNAKNEEILRLQKEVEQLRSMAGKGETLDPSALVKEEEEDTLDEGGGVDKERKLKEQETLPSKDTTADALNAVGSGDTIDKMCVFCGKKSDELKSSEAMEGHYLKECPMLQSCSHCHQVIEIAGLTKHWLTECEAKDKFQECPLCKEAVKKSAFDSHIEEGNCQGGGGAALEHGGTMGESNRCPLCHSNIPAGDESWRAHLMGPSDNKGMCPKRRKVPRARSPPPRGVGGGAKQRTELQKKKE